MGWTVEGLDRIRDAYWRTRSAACPSCGGGLDVRARRPLGSDRLELVADCRACNESWTIGPETDSLRGRFREWTGGEKLALLAGFARGDLRCPADGSLLDVREESAGAWAAAGETALVIRCGRCWQSCAGSR